jgi:phage terminase Nu1 subunit (DNA packaging protein)
MPPQQYPVAAIAQLLKLGERRVQQLVKDGILPRPSKGVYDPIACVHGYIDYLKRLAAGSGELSLSEERTRLTKFQADLAELQLRKASGKLIESKRAAQVWGEIVTAIRQRLLGLASRLAPQVATSQSIPDIKERLDAAIGEVLNELCNPDLEQIARAESSIEGVAGFPAAAEVHGEPVGRSKKAPEPGK